MQPSEPTRASTGRPGPRRFVPIIVLTWTLLGAAALTWWQVDPDLAQSQVIRLNPDATKSWAERFQETGALLRLNFHWAFAWVWLGPAVLWIGCLFPFETRHWASRAAILTSAGFAFVGLSHVAGQWLSPRQAIVVMLNYSETTRTPGGSMDSNTIVRTTVRSFVTNRTATLTLTNALADLPGLVHREFSATRTHGLPPGLDALSEKLAAPGRIPPDLGGPRRWSFLLDGFAYIALLGLAHAGTFHRRYQEREQQAVAMQARLNEARLHALQAQLQPHFLFNSLNGVATLLRRDPVAAEEMLTSLSDLLRIALSGSTRQEIPLREELDFLDRYLAIQQMRFGDRLQSTQSIDPAAAHCLVPALLLQPLVENAIRHGIEPSGQPGLVRISATRTGDSMVLTVEDNGVGLKPSGPSPTSTGVGLANVRERLEALYGARHDFQLVEPPAGGVAVRIRLPARDATPALPVDPVA